MSRQPSSKLKRLIVLPFIVIMAASFSVSWTMYLIGSRESMRDLIRTVIREVAERVNETTKSKLEAALNIAEANAAFLGEFRPELASAELIQRSFLNQLRSFDSLSILSVGMSEGLYVEAQRCRTIDCGLPALARIQGRPLCSARFRTMGVLGSLNS